MVFDKATNTLSCQDAYSILNPNSSETKLSKILEIIVHQMTIKMHSNINI